MLLDKLKTLPQYCVPQHGLTWLMGKLAASQRTGLKNFAIQKFIDAYGVDMSQSLIEDPTEFACFNDFFIRHLKPGLRPITDDPKAIISPADGAISQIGRIEGGKIIQAKGHHFTVKELLGGDIHRAEPFFGGNFATIYLAPKDYHRVHMPVTGKLQEMIYIPGKLFSVSDTTARSVPQLFSRNERAVCFFEHNGARVAVILVGAMIVASMNTVWHGDITPPRAKKVRQWQYPNPKTEAITLQRGDEMGYFKLGSTVIVLFEKEQMQWNEDIQAHMPVQMGQTLGVMT